MSPLVAMAEREREVRRVIDEAMTMMTSANAKPTSPTTYVSRKNRMTPRMFCKLGKMTPTVYNHARVRMNIRACACIHAYSSRYANE